MLNVWKCNNVLEFQKRYLGYIRFPIENAKDILKKQAPKGG